MKPVIFVKVVLFKVPVVALFTVSFANRKAGLYTNVSPFKRLIDSQVVMFVILVKKEQKMTEEQKKNKIMKD